jgi:hypothetical protein
LENRADQKVCFRIRNTFLTLSYFFHLLTSLHLLHLLVLSHTSLIFTYFFTYVFTYYAPFTCGLHLHFLLTYTYSRICHLRYSLTLHLRLHLHFLYTYFFTYYAPFTCGLRLHFLLTLTIYVSVTYVIHLHFLYTYFFTCYAPFTCGLRLHFLTRICHVRSSSSFALTFITNISREVDRNRFSGRPNN